MLVRFVFFVTINLFIAFPDEANAQTCGKSSMTESKDEMIKFIAEDNVVAFGKFPWHAAIHLKSRTNDSLICGATIISTRFLVTSAHCFCDETQNCNHAANLNNFRVAVGQLNAQINEADREAKLYDITKIIKYSSNNGTTNKSEPQIVIIQTNKDIDFNANVTPICLLDQNEKIKEAALLYTAGWGVNENGTTDSDYLRFTRLPYISHNYCTTELPPNLMHLLRWDEFCTGKSRDRTLDRGDLGGGIVIRKSDGSYYLVGIIDSFLSSPPLFIFSTYAPIYSDWIKDTSYEKHQVATKMGSVATVRIWWKSLYEQTLKSWSNFTNKEIPALFENIKTGAKYASCKIKSKCYRWFFIKKDTEMLKNC